MEVAKEKERKKKKRCEQYKFSEVEQKRGNIRTLHILLTSRQSLLSISAHKNSKRLNGEKLPEPK